MSRYYDITLTPPGSSTPVRQWTSHPKGTYDPQAQNVELDLYEYNYSTPAGASTISIEGISLSDIGEATQYTGMTIQIRGGMKVPIMPLNNPAQAGTLVTGQVFQAFGNWEGTDMSLDFVILASAYTFDMPGNFIFQWKKGSPLGLAIATMLKGAFFNVSPIINISPDRIAGSDHVGYYHSLEQTSRNILTLTKGKLGASDPGVQISMSGTGVPYVYDYTQPSNPKDLQFTDFVGQPTWIAPYEIQLKLVLRGDISVGTLLRMPLFKKNIIPNAPGIVTTQAASLPSYTKQNVIFQGNFFVTKIRHIGNFRQADGAGWVTIVNAIPAGSVLA